MYECHREMQERESRLTIDDAVLDGRPRRADVERVGVVRPSERLAILVLHQRVSSAVVDLE
jgi:hypothetical protein